MSKYIIVTGGYVASIDKCLFVGGLAALLKAHGFKVGYRKLDTYFNTSIFSITSHQNEGPFVTSEREVVCRNAGYFERFTGQRVQGYNWTTFGNIYTQMLERIKNAGYGGAPVRMVPQMVDALNDFITGEPENESNDFVLVDLGGTVGETETGVCLEAVNKLQAMLGKERTMLVHMNQVHYNYSYGGVAECEIVTVKHSVEALHAKGICPDLLVCKFNQAARPGSEASESLADACHLPKTAVLDIPKVKSGYEMPLILRDRKLDKQILTHFGLAEKKPADLRDWEDFVHKLECPKQRVTIGICGKYGPAPGIYAIVCEALHHAGAAVNTGVNIELIDSIKLEDGDTEEAKKLASVDGFLFPGGFAKRGTEGMIIAINYARIHKIPTLGVCLGEQLMAIEYARNVLGLDKATSVEFDPDTTQPVVVKVTEKLHLGLSPVEIVPDTKLAEAYQVPTAKETYGHSLGVDLRLKDAFEAKGLTFSAFTELESGQIVAGLELKDHPWAVAVQFHPEFRSTPFNPQAIYMRLIRAVVEHVKPRPQNN